MKISDEKGTVSLDKLLGFKEEIKSLNTIHPMFISSKENMVNTTKNLSKRPIKGQ